MSQAPRALALALLSVGLGGSALAQPTLIADVAVYPEEPPAIVVAPPERSGDATGLAPEESRDVEFAQALMDLRLEHRLERRRGGFWLLGWGVLNAVGGGLVVAVQHDDPAWRMAGAITASFGAINAALSFGLLDRRERRLREILDGRLGAHTRPDDVREAELVSQLRSGQVFAMNFGLDVFYMAVGGLLYALGRALDEPALNGAGLATAFQGAWLFGFDLAEWRQANARAEAMRALRR